MVWHNFCRNVYMKNLLSILFAIAPFLGIVAQSYHPQRTPEDIARKQTEMLVRELSIQDNTVRDTLYRMHLKFANKRAISHTRAEAMQYMQEANDELRTILTPEQYQQFMNKQVNHHPHRNQAPCNRIIPAEEQMLPTNLHDGESNMPPTPPLSRL